MGRANKSSSSWPLEECVGAGGRLNVASSKEPKPRVVVLVEANAFSDPRPAWRCCAANESGGLWAWTRRCCGWLSCGVVVVLAV
jgi:hypothetical protein